MLNPALLWLLPIIAIPVALHLLNLFRLRTVELPTFRFLMESYVQQRRRIRLLEWLLMLLRTAVVAAVLFALARPVVERFGGLFGGGRSRDVVLLVDAGISGGLVTDGVSGLHRLREAAQAAVERLSAGDFVTLLRAGMEPQVVFRAAKGDGRRLAAELDALESDPGTADLAAAVTEAIAVPARGPRTLWVFTDGDARGWKRFADHPASRSIPADVTLVVADVGRGGSIANRALLGTAPRAQKPVVGLPVELTARVDATAEEAGREVPLSVWIDDALVAQLPVAVRPDGPATVRFSVVPPRAGVIRGRFELPADAFSGDDAFDFVLNVEPRVGVLVIAPPKVEPLEDAALFVGAALAAPLEALSRERSGGTADASAEATLARSLEVTVVRADAVRERQVRDADVLVLADACPSGDRRRWLRARIEEGAGAVVFAGPRLDRREFSELVTVEPVEPARKPRSRQEQRRDRKRGPVVAFGEPVGDPDDERSALRLGRVDRSHPVFSAFAAPRSDAAEESRDALDTLVMLRHAPLVVADREEADRDDQRPTVDVIATLEDGAPAIAETHLGRGRIVVSGIAATPDWSNLPVHPAFVPIVLRSVQHVRPDRRVAIAESVRPYEPAPVRLETAWRGGAVQATLPGGATRGVDTVPGDSGLTGALQDTRRTGIYEFEFQPPPGGTLEPVRLGMAVNPEVESATFSRLDEAGIRSAFGGRPLMYVAGTAADPVLAEQLGGRREIWRWLIGAALACMAAEFLLGTLAPPRPRGAGDRGGGWRERITTALGNAVGNVEAAA